MSEIEKLYENAKIKPYIYCSKPRLDCDAREKGSCKQDCEYYSGKKLLTQFTAEKQLKLIEFFISSIWWENLKILYKTLDCSMNFEDKLARIVNYLWLSLTEEEKEQIRRILNG